MYGWRGRMGIIMPDNNTVLEPELYSVLPRGVSLHGSRAVMHGVPARERIPTAVAALPTIIDGLRKRVGVLGYACMTTSLIMPVGWHEALADATQGVPFLPAGETMLKALEKVGAQRIGVFSPFMDEVAVLVPDWFAQFGIQVVHNFNVPFTRDQVTSHGLQEFYPLVLREFRGKEMDALAVLATDLATLTIINTLEKDLGVPVVSSNLALLWSALSVLGLKEDIGIGRLFKE
jgi:maleate cis-trans isomerase